MRSLQIGASASLLAAALVIGCGKGGETTARPPAGGGSPSRTSTQLGPGPCPPVSQGARSDAAARTRISNPYKPPGSGLLACVGQQPIVGERFSHWLELARIASKLKAPDSHLLAQTMDFLIRADWYIGEASRDRITVSDATVHRSFERAKREQFHSQQQFKDFLRSSGETVADVLYRVRIDILDQRLIARFHITAPTSTVQARLDQTLRAKWKGDTYCRREYVVVRDCGHQL